MEIGEEFMVTRFINKKETELIISTPQTKVKEMNVFNDVFLTHQERIAHATNILKSRKSK